MSVAASFTSNEIWTLSIATYAAVISTFVLGWDAYKWLAAGAKIEVSASGNMRVVGGGLPADPKSYIAVTASNIGDRPTTITNLGGMHFDSWWQAYIRRRRPAKAFIVSQPSQTQQIPYRFEVGSRWMGLVDQDGDTVYMARNGYLFLIVYTVERGRGHRVRVTINPVKSDAA